MKPKYQPLFLIFVMFVVLSHAQTSFKTFILQGSVNSDTGTMMLESVNLNEFYPPTTTFKETRIKHGKFVFRDSILYPYAYTLSFKIDGQKKYISSIFFVEPGLQTVVCNIDSIRETPKIYNSLMNEFKDDYISRYGIRHVEVTDLLQYTKQHRNSYVALWNLIKQFKEGYKPEYDSIYNLFSDTIKNTYSGEVLARKLNSTRIAAIGRLFPEYWLLNVKNKQVKVPYSGTYNKYTLIDFWYSHCGPCISQFPILKNLYANGKSNGFEIIGISVDSQENMKNWLKAIKKYKLPWQQYLDMGAQKAYKLGIIDYPCNFLLDSAGKIIAKNMSVSELNNFLRDKQMIR